MTPIAVICPVHRRFENTFPLLHRLLVATTVKPAHVFWLCEDSDDTLVALEAVEELSRVGHDLSPLRVWTVPTPHDTNGKLTVVPFSHKINVALDVLEMEKFEGGVVYCDNSSFPSVDKLEVIAHGLVDHPQVYITQRRTGYAGDHVHPADTVLESGYCATNFTQVGHRFPVKARWSLKLEDAYPTDLCDAWFFRHLSEEFEDKLYPVGGLVVHDEHHMESPAPSH